MTQHEKKLELYKSSVDLFKHFNGLIDKVRIIVITSGVLVFGAAGKVYADNWANKENILILISLWGLAFISSMWVLANHYLLHTESIARGARSIESELLGEEHLIDGAFMRIHLDHNRWKLEALKEKKKINREKTFGERLKKRLLDYSTFLVMWLGCLMLFLFAIFNS